MEKVHLYYSVRLPDADGDLIKKYLEVYIKSKMNTQVQLQGLNSMTPSKSSIASPDIIRIGIDSIRSMIQQSATGSVQTTDENLHNWYMFLGTGDMEKHTDVFVILLCKRPNDNNCLYIVYKHKIDVASEMHKEEQLANLSKITKCLDNMFATNNTIKMS